MNTEKQIFLLVLASVVVIAVLIGLAADPNAEIDIWSYHNLDHPHYEHFRGDSYDDTIR